MDWDLKWLPVWSSNGELENSDRGKYFCFRVFLLLIQLVFWFLLILVHSIIKNGEMGLNNA